MKLILLKQENSYVNSILQLGFREYVVERINTKFEPKHHIHQLQFNHKPPYSSRIVALRDFGLTVDIENWSLWADKKEPPAL